MRYAGPRVWSARAATVAFRAFHHLMTHRTGRPNYPEPVTWNVIVEWIEWYHLTRGE